MKREEKVVKRTSLLTAISEVDETEWRNTPREGILGDHEENQMTMIESPQEKPADTDKQNQRRCIHRVFLPIFLDLESQRSWIRAIIF